MSATALASGAEAADKIVGPTVGKPSIAQLTVPLSSLPMAEPSLAPTILHQRVNPLAHEPDQGRRGTDRDTRASTSTVAGFAGGRATPSPILSFQGQSNACSCTPPDPVGDVGPNHYVQMVNATKIAIYNKAGTLLPGYPKDMNSLFSSGNCAASSNGDPVVLYDSLADRWLLAQFSTGNGVCVAVSQTGDPTGSYFGYEFLTPSFPDYLKFGVWSDGYYMSTNETSYAAYAFDRDKMLVGQPASSIRFAGVTNFMLPSDVDGRRAPPAGSPNYFYTFKDDAFHGGSDVLEVREFHADFGTPANSTFTLTDTIPITSFTYTVCGFFNLNCIPQGSTAQKVDPVSEWPMFRFPYRNFGTHEALAGNFTVDGGSDRAVIRWFELRQTAGGGWTLQQEGTVGASDSLHRWMGSIAMDGAGNLALGYSVSSASMFPELRYAVHRVNDAPGTMQPEATLVAGAGSQTGSNRWGDYSAMTLDPDDYTFWYTAEHYPASSSSGWSTRIGSFRIVDTAITRSVAANDGDIRETSELSAVGGTIAAGNTFVRLGDDGARRQYRAILDFDTSGLPDTAVVTSAYVSIFQNGAFTGADPFTALGSIAVDIKKELLSGDVSLQSADFEAAASLNRAALIAKPAGAVSGSVYTGNLIPAANKFISLTGRTQLRLRFQTDDNNDALINMARFSSGDIASVNLRPKLVVRYYVP